MSLYDEYRPRKSFWQYLLRWILIISGIFIFVWAWRVTEIDLAALPEGFDDVKPLLSALMHPEVLSREEEDFTITALLQVPCSDDPPAQMKPREEGYMILSSTCADRGEEVGVVGQNFPPDTEISLRLAAADNPRIDILDVVTSDGDGSFETVITVPSDWLSREEFLAHRLQAQYTIVTGPLTLSETTKLVIDKMIETVLLAMMATALAVVFAVPISFFAARNLMTRSRIGTVIYYVVRLTLNLLRAIEPLIWAIIFAVWVGVGPFAGVLALTLHSIAALGKLYSEQIESIDPGPIEAVTATGANPLQNVIYGVVPQIVPPYIAFTLYRWDINVRMSTVIGLVGGGGIGFLLIQWINLLQYKQAAVAVWAIAIVVAIMDYVSAVVRERLV
ncbi:MAG: phosphonate ABC transporter, permease protein PhnE [Chloroflexota bacterium]|nr:phosphonate ABC transporter, permease protein PhnE [Chloroflexota bacterium]